MLEIMAAFGGLTTNDLAAAKEFYTKTLQFKLADEVMGLNFELPGGGKLYIYQKDDHVAPGYTVLNLVVADIDTAVAELVKRGVRFEIYDNMPAKQDEHGVLRGIAAQQGPDIAWFKDPAGNIVSVMQPS